MATNNQPTEQNAIDNLNSTLTTASEHVAKNKKIIYWCLGVVIAIGACAAAWFWLYKIPQNNNSWKAYEEVYKKAAGNDSIAAAEYGKVASKYGSTDAGRLAALQASEAYYKLGKYNETIKYLQDFSCEDPLMDAQSRVLLGDAYVNVKKYPEAIDAYNSALRKAEGNPEISPVVLWKQANVYDAEKKYQNAMDCYTQIRDNYPEFALGNGMAIDAYVARESARLGK